MTATQKIIIRRVGLRLITSIAMAAAIWFTTSEATDLLGSDAALLVGALLGNVGYDVKDMR